MLCRFKPTSSMLGALLLLAALSATTAAQRPAGGPPGAQAQGPRQPQFPTDNAVIRAIWTEGMDNSQAARLAQTLTDSVGPRLTGTPGMKAANDWAVSMFRSWGIDARNEQYGTWRAWRRGITHIDLIAPRVRTLEGMILAWSPGTRGAVEGRVMTVPTFRSPAEFQAWLPQTRGNFVLVTAAQPSCRPTDNWEEFGAPGAVESIQRQRADATAAYSARIASTGLGATAQSPQAQAAAASRELVTRLEAAGAAGVIQSNWSNGWGVNKIFNARTERMPVVDVSCEDYGLIFRLAENNQGPRVRLQADAQFLGEQPVFNTIAEIKGTEKPNEYIVLSAHYDSWDGASGATDNATGSVTMMEAARILKKAYPNPKRTIIVGLWSGEEQGLNGSRAFAADHPEIVQGLQALFNQDNGTGRVVNIGMQGLVKAGEYFGRWMTHLPTDIASNISLNIPGSPGGGGSDYASFICHGAPAFSLSSLSWDYGTYTWHTNRDTYDKIVIDDLKNNAVLTAMLTYLAAEEPELLPRDRRVLPMGRNGQPGQWPQCQQPARSSGESNR